MAEGPDSLLAIDRTSLLESRGFLHFTATWDSSAWLLTSSNSTRASLPPSAKMKSYMTKHNHRNIISSPLPHSIGEKQVAGSTHIQGQGLHKGQTPGGGDCWGAPQSLFAADKIFEETTLCAYMFFLMDIFCAIPIYQGLYLAVKWQQKII